MDRADFHTIYIAVTPRDQQRAEELRLRKRSRKEDEGEDGSGLQEKMRVLVQLWRDGILSDVNGSPEFPDSGNLIFPTS